MTFFSIPFIHSLFVFQGIVQSLIAELLNSSSWKDRETACKVIPKLKGGINKV